MIERRSKAHKRLKEHFLIGWNRTECANFEEVLFFKLRTPKTEKQTINLAYLVSVGCWRLAEGKGHETQIHDWTVVVDHTVWHIRRAVQQEQEWHVVFCGVTEGRALVAFFCVSWMLVSVHPVDSWRWWQLTLVTLCHQLIRVHPVNSWHWWQLTLMTLCYVWIRIHSVHMDTDDSWHWWHCAIC